jgi:hypothetical protein
MIAAGARARLKPKYDGLERRLAKSPAHQRAHNYSWSDADGVPHRDSGSYAKKFSSQYLHRSIEGGAPKIYTPA